MGNVAVVGVGDSVAGGLRTVVVAVELPCWSAIADGIVAWMLIRMNGVAVVGHASRHDSPFPLHAFYCDWQLGSQMHYYFFYNKYNQINILVYLIE